ncbi:MAG: DUF4974 domain-containing protein [Bacteroidetes bacterium]|nr:DUF4974 domain-containing protein [Bacteroidota bacterium]
MKEKDFYMNGFSEEKWGKAAAFISGEGSEVTDFQVNEILSESDMPLTSELWKETGRCGKTSASPDTEAAWNKVYDRLASDGHIARLSRISRLPASVISAIKVAASLLLIASIGYVTWQLVSGDSVKPLTVASHEQKNMAVTLPDGSRVTLNRFSSISYPAEFKASAREVILTGEAFFEVERDEALPFRVIAGSASVEVLGTTFSINTGGESGVVEVFVNSGSVMLSSGDNMAGIVLTEGYIGSTAEGKTVRYLNENPNYLAWNTGILKYEAASLEEVFSDLKRTYGIEIEADSQMASEKLITTTFDNVSELEIIQIISATFNLAWKKDGRVYVFSQQ